MRFLFLIPARGGSKGIPKKNMKMLGSKPLIHYAIKCAKSVVKKNSKICVSSDDREIITYAQACGIEIPFIRPSELAGDSISQYDVIMHAIDFYEGYNEIFDAVVLLQPTSPLRNSQHLTDALALYNNNLDMVVSVKKTDANPYFVLYEENPNGFLVKVKEGKFIRRQDCPAVWQLNGAIYIINIKSLKNCSAISELKNVIKFVMPEINSIDIDTELDWEFCEFLLKKYDYLIK